MSARTWGDAAAAVFVLALIGLAVRPSSLAPAFITVMGDALTALVGFAAEPGTSGATASGPARAPGGTVYA